MKIKSYLLAPLCGAMALVVLGSCSDEQIVNGNDNGRPEGNGIVFGASANYIKKPGTKTAYGDYNDPINPTSQEILWLTDDRVEVWSPTSPSVKQVEYQITNIDAEDGGSAYLASYQGRNGLQWDKGSETQDFYAVYPSPASIKNQEMVQEHNIRLEEGVLHGFIPTNQEYQFTRDASAAGGWKCTPTMDWQYMVARTDNFKVPEDGTDGGVYLNFKPLVTTLEITLEGPSSPLAQLNVIAPEDKIIMGEFSCKLTGDSWGEGFLPICEAEQTGTVTNYITVNLYDTGGAPITLAEGEHLTINVFMLPTERWTDLEIRLAGYNTAARTMQLDDKSTPIELREHLKTRVKVSAPNIGENETNQWIGALNDNVLITQLSIPGAANAFSNSLTGTTAENIAKWKTQATDIEEQWNRGIRCFELVCPENGGNVAGSLLACNRRDISSGLTFASAVDQIWDLVQTTVDEEGNPTEFAVIIPSYDSDTGHDPNNHSGVDDFANGLNAFYNAHGEYKYQTFTRELTVGEARGSLIFIARITSEEDGDYQVPEPAKGTFVDQWGSLADNWARRGYAANGTRVNNWGQGAGDTQSVEYYRHTEENSNKGTSNTGEITALPPGNALTASLSVDFEHSSRRAGGGSGTAYIQDWRRVVPRKGIVEGLRPGMFYLGRTYGFFTGYTYHYYYWPESLTEKEKHIWDTFEKAIAENAVIGGGEKFYINSLDGYFVDPSIRYSYMPYVANATGSWGTESNPNELGLGGTEGNIEAYANYINNYFYNRILEYGVTNIYGPMNIILMDYVYDGTAGGDRLPSTIINNNFRFPLQVKTETNSFGDGGTSMGNGGSAIE